MIRTILLSGVMIVCGMMVMTGCNDPVTGPSDNRNVIFSEGFEGTLAAWEGVYMVNSEEMYRQMRITSDAAHGGNSSLTTDSNMTALYHREGERFETGTVGVEFYLMATATGKANFGVRMGQNPGSSGAVSPSFGIEFDPSDSIKCIFFTTWPANDIQTTIAPIQPGKWYKCQVEINCEDSTATYYIDDKKVHTQTYTEDIGFYGIDQLLVFRGKYGKIPLDSEEGAKPYYVDDITFYTLKTAD
ncbi:MAG: hypothetical protein JW863_19860 [Chitinispirillaceae bacterium]|nr:hypothetical protein [Chitinispirillaceae bacterium]